MIVVRVVQVRGNGPMARSRMQDFGVCWLSINGNRNHGITEADVPAKTCTMSILSNPTILKYCCI